MAGVKEINLNPEQKSAEQAGQSVREDTFADKLVQSVDLPASLSTAIEEEEKKRGKDPLPEADEPEEEEAEEAEESKEAEEPEQAPEKKPESSEDEDLVPRSKVQKRIDELTREKIQLETRLRRLEEGQVPAKPKDEELAKLEAMDEPQLRQLKKEVRLAQIKNSSDETKVSQFLELEDKIDEVLRSAPQRFQHQQVSSFNEAVQTTAQTLDGFEKVQKEIFAAAQSIYRDSPELQGAVTGQARAWNLAVEHFKQLSQISAGKSKAVELERQVNDLKKKVSMDTGTQKAASKEPDERKMFNKAKYGTTDDKLAYFKKKLNTDSFIPEEFLNR